MRCKGCTVGLLGACNGDYCRVERTVLIQHARQIAEGRSHNLGEFAKVAGIATWRSYCECCGRPAIISLDLRPNKPDVYGEAITVGCIPPDN
jgi:hypothetical protein